MTNLHFCSCIPRSGSTLLLNILAQNPIIHVTPTNALADIVIGIRDSWMMHDAFKSQGLKKIEHRVVDGMRGVMRGFFESELVAQTVIDKSRLWLGYIDLLERVLCEPVKIIVTVRAIEDVLASLEKLYRVAPVTVLPYQGPLRALRQTIIGRCQSYMALEGEIGQVTNRLRDALQRGYRDRLIIVPYKDLTSRPQEVVNEVTRLLNLEPFPYDTNNVQQLTEEDDSVYGIDLHKIHEGRIRPDAVNSWRDIIPADYVAQIQKDYTDINRLAVQRSELRFTGS